MAGEQTEVVDDDLNIDAAVEDDGDDGDFTGGFAESVRSGARVRNATERLPEVAAPAPAAAPAVIPEAAAPAPAAAPKVEYAKVTKADLESLLAMRGELAALKDTSKRNADTTGGRLGQLKQTIDQLQAATQQGKPVELSDEDVAEITAMYPDLGKSVLSTLQKVVGKLKGTGASAPAGPAFDPGMVDQRVQQFVPQALVGLKETIRNELAAEQLQELHPDWLQVAGAPGQQTEFRVWLKNQGGDYEKKVLDSNNAATIAAAMTKFKESKASPKTPAAPAKRAGRFADAITPKSAGSAPAPASTEDDEFEAGFRSFK